MYLIFLPWLIGSLAMAIFSFSIQDYSAGFIFSALSIPAFLLLIKTTKNYIKNAKQKPIEELKPTVKTPD